jgi:hypothetical protein
MRSTATSNPVRGLASGAPPPTKKIGRSVTTSILRPLAVLVSRAYRIVYLAMPCSTYPTSDDPRSAVKKTGYPPVWSASSIAVRSASDV